MKSVYVIAVLLLLAVGLTQGQTLGGDNSWRGSPGTIVKTYTTYTSSSGDTTSWLSLDDPVLKTNVLLANQVYLVGKTTDSAAVKVTLVARNAKLVSPWYTAYTENDTVTDNISNQIVIAVKGTTVDRFPGMTDLKIGTKFLPNGQGTTAGRKFAWYLVWVK